MPSRDTYYQTCIEQGLSHDQAEAIADGLVAAQARQVAALPGWETLVAKAPLAVRKRAQQLFVIADKSNPDREASGRFGANVQAVFAFGVFAGMLLGRGGQGPSEAEEKASRTNLPELWEWLGHLGVSTARECPGCGHEGDGPWPWWDGNGECPKCGGDNRPWGQGVLHAKGWEGDEGLLMIRDGETAEECIARHELEPGDDWRVVRARRVQPLPSRLGDGVDMDYLVENLDEYANDGVCHWHAQWGDQILFPRDGAEDGLRDHLDAWAKGFLEARAWEIHPGDQTPDGLHPCPGCGVRRRWLRRDDVLGWHCCNPECDHEGAAQ